MPLANSTYTVQNIATAVKRQFGDESGTQINDEDIFRWVNQGQRDICQKGEVNKSTATTVSVAGQNAYSFPSDSIVKVLAVFYKEFALESTSFEQVQEVLLKSGDTTLPINDVPSLWYEWDDSIYLYPTPNSSNDVIKVYAILMPITVTSLMNTLTIPDTHYNVLLNYVLQQAYELDDNFGSASVKETQTELGLNNLIGDSSYKTYPTITVLPEDL